MRTPEQIQFQGQAQSIGFNPVTPASATPLIQQNVERVDASRREVLAQQRQNEDAVGRLNAQMAGRDLMALASFSETLSGVLTKEVEAKNERDMQEGLSMAYLDGVDPADELAFDIAEEHLRQTDDGVQKYGDYVQSQGADFLGVQKLRELSGWKAYGYAQGVAMKASSGYANFLQERMANLDPELPVAEKAAILARSRQEFFSQTGMLGINPALLNKYAFPGMREVDSAQLNKWRGEEVARQQDAMIGESQELMGADPVGNFSKAMDTLVRSGKFNRTSARDALLRDIKDPDTIDAIGSSMSWDGKLSWAEKYPVQWAAARREAIRGESADYNADKLEMETEGRRWADQVIEEWEQNPPSDDVIEQTRRKMDDDFGFIDPRLERWVKRSTDAEAAAYYKDYLDRADRAGTLTEAMVNNPDVPSEVRNSFLGRAQQADKARSDSGSYKAYEKQLEEDLKRVAKQNSLEPGAAGLELATAKAQAMFKSSFMKAIQSGADPDQAAQDAYGAVKQQIDLGTQGSGTFAFNDVQGFHQVIPKGSVTNWLHHKTAITKLLKENKAAALDRNALIPQSLLEDAQANASNPDYQPPAIAQYISDTLGGTVTPWAVMDRQSIARGLGPLNTGQRFQQVTQGMSPQMTRLLHYKPSYNRVARSYGSTGAFDPNKIPRGYGATVLSAATQYGIDPAILAGVIEVESTWNKDARSGAGAVGIAQIVPKWHPTVDPTNAIASINYAAKYLSELRQQLGSMDEAIYAYNSGPGLIRQSAENRAYHPKVMKAAAKYGFNPTGNAWSNPAFLNPRLAYVTGNIGPTSTGPHLDVKQVGGGDFKEQALDNYVVVDDPQKGRVPLSQVGVTAGQANHRRRNSHGIDYGTYSGTKVYLKGGAKVVSSVSTEHGDKVTIELPNKQRYTFLHGRRA